MIGVNKEPPHVLIVEDDDELRRVIRAALIDAGYAASEAPDGAAGLRECQHHDPDVILLDLAMPRLDGQAFVEAYRQLPESRGKIVVITGTASGGETSGRIRASAFLSKPFDLDRLLGAVRSLVAGPTP